MRFELADLRLFTFVAETGSITHGAERAGLALASASARLKGLEERLGVALLVRGRRGVTLTAAGRALVHHAQNLQGQIEQLTGDLGHYAKGLRAQVRLLANTAGAAAFLPQVLAPFLRTHAHIDIDLEERPSRAVVAAVASGAADLGIAADWADLAHLQQRPFRTDRLVVVTAPGHRELAPNAVSLDEIAAQPFVGLSAGSPLQEHIIRHAARLGHHLGFRIRVPTLNAVCDLVAADVGIAIVPAAAAENAPHRLRQTALREDWAVRALVVCARSFTALTPQAGLLAEALAAK